MHSRHLVRDGKAFFDISKSDGCKPITQWFRLCWADVGTILGVAFFIWYIIWGAPMTVRLFKSYRAKRAARKLDDDLEASSSQDDSEVYLDPYLSQTWQLYSYIRLGGDPPAPQPIYNPYEAADMPREKDVMDRFRFPVARPSSAFLPLASRPSLSDTFCSSISNFTMASARPGSAVLSASFSSMSFSYESALPTTPPPAYLDHSFGRGRVPGIDGAIGVNWLSLARREFRSAFIVFVTRHSSSLQSPPRSLQSFHSPIAHYNTTAYSWHDMQGPSDVTYSLKPSFLTIPITQMADLSHRDSVLNTLYPLFIGLYCVSRASRGVANPRNA
ncbi:hypothetical protein A0H81_11273 [Grifola frondosa]|uniref:Uncharacterized protein n=1 Tax=Grifola frondosa TaxID=5627 RepID=A0A1C7LWF6_GRIFR|nr:hypothetical protein A0H81_11273 [Grifola frondosa]